MQATDPSPARADAGTEQRDFQAGVTALLNRSKNLLLTQAWLNRLEGVARAQGAINALQALQGNAAQMAANKDATSEGGYSVCAIFQAAWPALPVDIEYLSMAKVQDFLALHGIKLAADTVANTNIDGVDQLQDHIVAAVDVDDKHDVARADVCDGAGCHIGSLVMGVDVQRDGIVTTGGADAGEPFVIGQGLHGSVLRVWERPETTQARLNPAAYVGKPLVVRPWLNHAATTIGYLDDKSIFVALADCSIGHDYAVSYEPLARTLAAAPDLLKALQDIVTHDCEQLNTHRLHAAVVAIQKANGVAP